MIAMTHQEFLRRIPRWNGKDYDTIAEALAQRELLLASLKEMRDACAAAMRVIVMRGNQEDFDRHLKISRVSDGFGKRADDLIARCEPPLTPAPAPW